MLAIVQSGGREGIKILNAVYNFIEKGLKKMLTLKQN
jgi:hypothetical protein